MTWGKNPDLKVSGYVFDVYSPKQGKTFDDKFAKRKARRFVLFLDDWILGAGACRTELTKFLQRSTRQVPGLEQILVVLKGKVFVTVHGGTGSWCHI